MIKIQCFDCNAFAEHCYMIWDETLECVLVDCGALGPMEEQMIADAVEAAGVKVVAHLLTHGHFDHTFGCRFVAERYGVGPTIAAADVATYRDCAAGAAEFGMVVSGTLPDPVRCLNDGDTVRVGNHEFTVLATPGHSPGSVAYYCKQEGIVLVGDTLFRGSIGRTDMAGGSMFQIIQSLRALTQLPDDTRVLPGHGNETTIGDELAHNPYLDR